MNSSFEIEPSRRGILRAAAASALLLALGAPRIARADEKMKIGVIGSGRLGGAVGALFVKAGYPVMFSARHIEEVQDLAKGLGPLASAGTPAEAAAYGEVMLIAVPYAALPDVGRENAAALKGKVVLDACNAVPARDGEALFDEAKEKGIGFTSLGYLPGTRLVRAFNSVNFAKLTEGAHRSGDLIAIPLASDDTGALQIAEKLVRDAGFEPVVVGGLKEASRFAVGTPVFGKALTAKELREGLGMPN